MISLLQELTGKRILNWLKVLAIKAIVLNLQKITFISLYTII